MAGTAAFGYVFPISIAIVILLMIVTISYEQTTHAYPGGGGAYIVSRDNLGESYAQVAGAALLMDYILTVAVSISSGAAQIVSAREHELVVARMHDVLRSRQERHVPEDDHAVEAVVYKRQ